jgi:diguanylate cyclase (GGDEF)-like protein
MPQQKPTALPRRALLTSSSIVIVLVLWSGKLVLDIEALHLRARQHAAWLAAAHRLAASFEQLSAPGPSRPVAAARPSVDETHKLYSELAQAIASNELELALSLSRPPQALTQFAASPQQIQPLAASIAAELQALAPALRNQQRKLLGLATEAVQRVRFLLLLVLLLGGLSLGLVLWYDRRHAQAELALAGFELRASHDAVTGVWNHGAILALFQSEAERAERGRLPLSVLKIQPQPPQTALSSEALDALLRETAVRISATLRPFDAVGRVAETTFLIVLPNCKAQHTGVVAERIRQRMDREPIDCAGVPLKAAARIGAAGMDEVVASSAHVLVRAAEAALLRTAGSGAEAFDLAGADELDQAKDPRVDSQPGSERRAN